MMQNNVIITILTDFGTRDGYVGSVKGVIKRTCPNAEIVDITQAIDPFDIRQAAFTLSNYYRQFPKGAIHLAVVDPGVGSERKAMILKTDAYMFVGPDNGLFHFIYENERQWRAYEINSQALPGKPKGSTFHARDIFGPAAAMLACQKEQQATGAAINAPVRLDLIAQEKEGSVWKLNIVSIDRFGNLITGLTQNYLKGDKPVKINKLRFKHFETNQVNDYYDEKTEHQPLFLWNSHGFLELAVTRGSAADYFNVRDKDAFIELEVQQIT